MTSKALKIAAVAGLALMVLATQARATELTVLRNGMVRVPLPASAGSVIVANPSIADVNVVDSHTIYVIGRGYGSSAVTVLDRAGHPIFDGQVTVSAGQHNAVMMYKGSTPSVMICSNVCQTAQDDSDSNPATAFLKAAAALAHPAGGASTPSAPAVAAPAASVANAAEVVAQ